MKVAEAFKILNSLTQLMESHKRVLSTKPNHCNYDHHVKIIKKLKKEIAKLNKCIYNQEMDDSYELDPNLVIWKNQ